METEKTKLASVLEKAILHGQRPAPSKQELDAFRMKVITLLKHQEVRFTSLTDQLHMIREVPIFTIEETLFSKVIAESIIAMQQTLTPFPGETIELKGAFKRYPQSHCRSIPIPESFRIVTHSNQTGFPHPSQHNGWALSPLFLPVSHSLAEKMKEISLELQPKARLNAKAKELLKTKYGCFENQSDKFLDLHQQLSLAMVKVANLAENQFLNAFFANIKKQTHPYNYLSNIHQQVLSNFVGKTYSPVQLSSFSALDCDYMTLIGTSYQEILNRYPHLLEELAIKQLQEFIFELETLSIPSPLEMEKRMEKLLLDDILMLSL